MSCKNPYAEIINFIITAYGFLQDIWKRIQYNEKYTKDTQIDKNNKHNFKRSVKMFTLHTPLPFKIGVKF